MQTVYLGESILLYLTVRDYDGDLQDPPNVELSVLRSGSSLMYGPYKDVSGDLTHDSLGEYRYNLSIESIVTPGILTAKWTYTLDGDEQVYLEEFQVQEQNPEPSTTLDAPRRYGKIRESSRWQLMGIGTTDRVFLIGHGDGIGINSPYEVRDVQQAINALGADSNSPLLRGLIESYNAGCRDIWLVAAARMSEYIPFSTANIEGRFNPNGEWGGLNFYERYNERLESTYRMLLDYDLPEIIVPLEAPYYDTRGVDFLTPLVSHCDSQFDISGSPAIGVIGTRIGTFTSEDVDAMANDERLKQFDREANFVMVTVGEGIYRPIQTTLSFLSPVQTAVVGAIATAPIDRGVTFHHLRGIMNIAGRDLTKQEVQKLVNAGLNIALRTQRGKRGTPYQCVISTDNVLGYRETDVERVKEGTGTSAIYDVDEPYDVDMYYNNIILAEYFDQPPEHIFYSVAQLRLVAKVIQNVKAISNRFIGTIGFGMLKHDIQEYLNVISLNGLIRGFTFDMTRDVSDPHRILVDISLLPFYGLREISFTVEVGPGG